MNITINGVQIHIQEGADLNVSIDLQANKVSVTKKQKAQPSRALESANTKAIDKVLGVLGDRIKIFVDPDMEKELPKAIIDAETVFAKMPDKYQSTKYKDLSDKFTLKYFRPVYIDEWFTGGYNDRVVTWLRVYSHGYFTMIPKPAALSVIPIDVSYVLKKHYIMDITSTTGIKE